MKKVLSLILVSVLIFSVAGCQTGANPTEAEKLPKAWEIDGKAEDAPQGITVNEIDFERIAIEDLDSELRAAFEEAKMERGYKLVKDKASDHYYLAVFAGQKPSAGYDVKIARVMDNEGITDVLVQEFVPGKDTMVAEMLTYPMDIVKLTGIIDNVNLNFVSKEKEEKMETDPLPLQNPNAPVSSNDSQSSTLLETKIVMAEYVGQIDNNSMEVKTEEGVKALRLNGIAKEQLADLNLDQGDTIMLEVFKNDNNQETVYSMKKGK
ncbi:protease complex subunit PrcB family protein [Petroclostridium sp. X23]|uniref:protease complex subunit PrcB family protein n=1 Tax=Petroclostridium sp. X23 TaxID=3045146 RepID=UPI0024AE2B1C|nr:protease complex subunit PrcB family protein [Petroclostridium sp. X23]WHH60197.1 protease complex subunit PrcB family protein [Petroclostridium sp. X23]